MNFFIVSIFLGGRVQLYKVINFSKYSTYLVCKATEALI